MSAGKNPLHPTSTLRCLVTLTICGLASPLAAQCPDVARFTPIAILDDGIESTVLEVATTGKPVSVTMRIDSGTPVIIQGASACGAPLNVTLHDDGTHGDRAAGDGTFTLDGIRYQANAPSTCTAHTFSRATPSLRGVYLGDITILRNGAFTTIPFNQYALWILPVSEFGIPEPVTRLSTDVQVSAHVVNIMDNQESVNRILSGEPGVSIQALSSKVYSVLPDAYDFLNFTTTGQRLCPGGKSVGLHIMVKQDWTGTGSLPFDNSASYGSSGKLLGINFIEQQSSDYFPTFAHETLHQWAAYLPALGLVGTGGHWSENTNIAGAVGGGAWSYGGDGAYSAISSGFTSTWRLPPLELYLMGLASASEVPPILVSETPPLATGYGSRFLGPFRQVTAAQIQQVAGPRLPGPGQSRNDFRAAYVVATPGRLLTQTEMTAYDRISRLFTGSLQPRPGNNRPTFAEITGGRATLETSVLPCSFTLSPSDLNVSASASTGTVFVSASSSSCRWTASAAGDWIRITGGESGLGNGAFSYSIAANPGAPARFASLAVTGAVSSQDMPVSQSGSFGQNVLASVNGLMRSPELINSCLTPGSCSDQPVTRGRMAVYLIRALTGGGNFSYSPTPYFEDVPPSHPNFASIQKLYEAGITSGCTPRRFCPASPVTRAEMAAFLVRTRFRISAAQGFPFPSAPHFTDIPMTNLFFPYIQKLRELGITLGCSATEYCPNSYTTEGQMALFLMRAFLVPDYGIQAAR